MNRTGIIIEIVSFIFLKLIRNKKEVPKIKIPVNGWVIELIPRVKINTIFFLLLGLSKYQIRDKMAKGKKM